MKRKYLFLIALTILGFNVHGQTDFKSSIRYASPFPPGTKNSPKVLFESESIDNKELPTDLNSSKIFFIEINKGDFPFIITGYNSINKKLIKGFKKYPFTFQTFPNEYLNKDKQYFIDQGFKYRVLIYSKFSQSSIATQYSLITLEDITTGLKYYYNGYESSEGYVKEFIKKTISQYGNSR